MGRRPFISGRRRSRPSYEQRRFQTYAEEALAKSADTAFILRAMKSCGYAGDWGGPQKTLEFIAQNAQLKTIPETIEYLDYDWSLNGPIKP